MRGSRRRSCFIPRKRSGSSRKIIIEAGRKLWHRQYVDGNGGNISCRLTPRYVICTPTMCSKGDLTEDAWPLVDLENRQLCGERPQTSEIPAAPGDLQGGAQGEGGDSLSSAVCDGACQLRGWLRRKT